MIELSPAGRGQMLTHGVYPPEELAEVRATTSASARDVPVRDAGAGEPAGHVPAARATRASEDVAALAHEVAELRAEVDRLGERVRELEERER